LTLQRKKHAVCAGLVLLTLWPAVHIYLVKRFDLSPWKLAGWGMYSAPRISMLGMGVYGRRSADTKLEQLLSLSADLRTQANDYLGRYRWLGELSSPESFARAVLARHSEWQELRVVVYRPVLDKTTGMIVMTSLVHDYRR
jgi:hypothetical protein